MVAPVRSLNVVELAAKAVEGSKGHVTRAITLVESTKPEHRVQAHESLQLVSPYIGRAFRVDISGVPGIGKSIFINAVGIKLIEKHNRQMAVLAIDPSPTRTGGSVLGDRTRMGDLAMRKEAFTRPSPSAGHLSGVTRTTRESVLVLGAAGYDVVLVETVGVGQSGVAVTGMVDTFLFPHVARTGDQLQSIERGILELTDVISITKANSGNEDETRVSVRELSIAMRLIFSDESRRRPPVLTCSSYTGAGMDEVWGAVTKYRADLEKAGGLVSHRRSQQRVWLWSMVEQGIIQLLRTSLEVRGTTAHTEADLAAERVSAVKGVSDILEAFAHTFHHPSHEPVGE